MSMTSRVFLVALSVTAFLVFHGRADAATLTASSCSAAAVQAAINASSTGDTVQVPAGTCSWDGATVTIPNRVNITLKGAGVDATVIRSAFGARALAIVFGSSRVTGFTWNCGHIQVDGEQWRIDHNTFTCSSAQEGVFVRGERKTASPKGVVDHNAFVNQRVLVFDYPGVSLAELQGTTHWAAAPQLGTEEAVYVEDNTFVFTQFFNAIDCNYSGRYVFRFNDVQDVYLEAHSTQGFNRACRKWEIYGNTIRQVSRSMYFIMFLRGGAGINFGNVATGTFGAAPNIVINNIRSCRDPGSGVGQCTGTAAWDGNASGQTGYLCRDQIGAGQDTEPWTATAPPRQTTLAAYFFLNALNGDPMGVTVAAGEPCPGGDFNSVHLQADRDYFVSAAGFTGARGVGAGPVAGRPATCATGVGYWATDQGNWNRRQPGPAGQLYRCTAPNTWSLHYVPYTYPHPLTAGGSGTPPPTAPSAPSQLIVR
jgi:hypothetical protein